MIRRITAKLTSHYDQKFAEAPLITTFAMGLHSPTDTLHAALTAHLFFDAYGQCDRRLLGCPLLLINSGETENNTVLMRDPHSEAWVNITHATEEELEIIAMGYQVPEYRREISRHVDLDEVARALVASLRY